MFTLNIGPCYRHSRLVSPLECPDIDDDDLSHIFDFQEFINRWAVGNRIVLDALSAASSRWLPGQPISILLVGCQRGDLARAIVNWARGRKVDVRVFAIDKFSRFVDLAKEHSSGYPEITYETRLLSDPMFLQAQHFDYVISAMSLHEQTVEEAAESLKKFNMLAKRGLIVTDWLRDVRAWCWMGVFSWLLGRDVVCKEATLAIRKGFTESDMKKICRAAGVDYLTYSIHLGYRFSVSGERGLVLSNFVIPAEAGIQF